MRSLKSNWNLMKYAFQFIPLFVIFTFIDHVFLGVVNSYATVIFLKNIFDGIEEGLQFTDLIVRVVPVFCLFIFGYVFHVFYLYILEPKSKNQLHRCVQEIIFKKLSQIDISSFDDADSFDKRIWIMKEADGNIISVIKDFGQLVNRFISVGTILSLLSVIDIEIAVFIAGAIVILLVLKMRQAKTEYSFSREMNSADRYEDYLGKLYSTKEYAKEIRSTGVEQIIDRELCRAKDVKKGIVEKYGRKLFMMQTAFDLFSTVVINIGLILFLLYKIYVLEEISLGDFVASMGSSWKLFWQLSGFTDVFGRIKKRELYSQYFFEFINKRNEIINVSEPRKMPDAEFAFSFRNVSFSYPGTEKKVLCNVSFDIKSGEKIAIVGYNGAGKSTLLRLLFRLYDPTEGEILLNGIDIREFDINEYRKVFCAVFQKFGIYAYSVAENVSMNSCEDNLIDETIISSLKKSGIWDYVSCFPNGIRTFTTKEFDKEGIELSGGQRQKLALARAFMNEKGPIVLDEPSSALDPISEYEMYDNLLDFSRNRTMLIVSHRLLIAKEVDRIIFLENGSVSECGSHEELLRKEGKYARMWAVQVKHMEQVEETGI